MMGLPVDALKCNVLGDEGPHNSTDKTHAKAKQGAVGNPPEPDLKSQEQQQQQQQYHHHHQSIDQHRQQQTTTTQQHHQNPDRHSCH